jgi:hypothetical protein
MPPLKLTFENISQPTSVPAQYVPLPESDYPIVGLRGQEFDHFASSRRRLSDHHDSNAELRRKISPSKYFLAATG